METRRSKSKSELKNFLLRKLFRRRQAEVSRAHRHLRFEAFEPRHLLAAAPFALADHYSVTESAALDVLAKGVLANDTDADGDTLTARLVAGPGHGTLALRTDGSFLYTPTSGYVGSDQFTYRANDGLLDSAITAVAIDVTNGPALRTGTVTGVTNQGWTRVTLDHGYDSMVVVATPSYAIGGTPRIARVRNAAGNSFEVRVERADGATAAVAATDVRYSVVEEGVYTLAQHGVKMEAAKFTSTQTDYRGSWIGQQRNYANAYASPVVVGQVMTANDADASVFWAHGATAGDAPSATQLYVGKHVGEHPDVTRAAEVIGYIVVDSGSGAIGSVAYVAAVGAETVQGPDNGLPASYGVNGLVAVSSAVVSPAGMNGLDGGWTVLAGSNSVSTSGLQLFFEEDRWSDTERVHVAEQAAYLVFGEASAPHLRTGTVDNVSSTEWTTVTLDRAYRSMVVVVTLDYAAGSAPVVARVRNATGSSFEVLVQRGDAATTPVTGIRVHYTVVEEGVYNLAQHGVKMEALKFTSALSDSARSWIGQQRAYANRYANPVVLGQVMTTNDPRMSVFWSRGPARVEAPTSSTLFLGKHVGEDRITRRAAEVIGYLVMESGAGSVSGRDYVAGVGASTVVGPDNGPPSFYPLDGPTGAAVAVVSAAGANGLDGGWAVLAGTGSVSDAGLRLFIEEDNFADAERVHAAERVAYVVFAASGAPTITSTPVTSATEDIAYSYDVDATDPDQGDTLTYSLTVAPAGMTIDSATGLLSWTPTAGQVGVHTITVRVQDAATSFDTQSFSVEVADVAQVNPYVRTGVLLDVSNTAWAKVTLDRAYNSMVVVTTPSYTAGNPPAVTRVRNASGNSFEVQVQRVDGSTGALSGITVYYTVVEEGVYTQDVHGVTMEAVKFTSTVTDSDSSWVGEQRDYHNAYTAPVVLGQVMTANDERFSTFWSRGASRMEIPSANSLYVGKHVGEDFAATRVAEVVGYLVIESGAGAIGSLSYVAGVGAGTVVGPDNSPPVTYSTNGPADATVAVLSASGARGLDGGWAVLAGSGSVTSSALRLFMEEDKLADAERFHVAERVAYLMFPPTNGPKITSSPVTTATEDVAYSYDVQATDPDAADKLTYSLVTAPSGMAINSTTGLISWTPTNAQVGASMVVVLVSDTTSATATQTFKLTVSNTNDAPTITSTPVTTATEDTAYSYDVNASDVDAGDTLTYALTTAPSGMTINATTGMISWTPTNARVGANSVTVRVRDVALAQATQTFTITVANTNDAPTITSTPVPTATEDAVYSYDVNATDVDAGDTLTYALTTAPAGMTINATTGMISWTPTNARVGANSVTVRVRDVALAQATQSFTITVANTNDAPTITSTPVTTATEDAVYSYDVNATDVDAGDTLTYALTTAPAGMTINATTGMISWTPTNARVGANSVTVRVRDVALAEATQTFTVTVANTNDAPTITSTPVTTGSVGTAYTYDVNATDVDAGDTLTYALTTAPTGMTINATTGVISWTPTLLQLGAQSVTVRVRDVALAQATQTFSVTVTDSNYAPVAGNDTYNATEATTLTVPAAGVLANDTDADNDALTAVLVAGPSHGTLTLNATGSFTYTPTTGFTGTDSFTYKASDGEANSNVATVNLMVNPLNTVLITAAWLAAQGAGPYLLTQANTNYILQTDVTVDGTAFVVGEANITLDLNGHTVTYGNAAPVVVNNGGFEVGTGRNVPGWNLSGATSASITPNTLYMWGDQVLTLSSFTGTQTIVSDPIALTQAGHEYAATITPKGPSDASVKLLVIDATTQQVLGSATSAGVNRGFSAVVTFVPATAMNVVLKVEITAASGKTQTVSLDYASLTPSRDYGISVTPSPWYWPNQLKSNTTAYKAAGKARQFAVKNGALVQGQAVSYKATAIQAQSAKGLAVDNVDIRVSGINTAAIFGQWIAENVVVENCNIVSTVDKVTNRMHEGAMLDFNDVSGVVSISNNSIVDHPRSGIEVSGGQGHTISYNRIDSNAIVTNCYGIIVMGVQHSSVHHNSVVTSRSGRGILVDGLESDSQDTIDLEIAYNTVDVRERPNLEYGTSGIEATALRLRTYREGGHQQLAIHDNSFTARTGAGLAHAAIGARVSGGNNASAISWNNVVENNTFRAIVDTADTYYWARAVTIENLARDTALKFAGNVFESNNISLGLGGNDGADAHDVLFLSNTFRKVADAPIRNYQAIRAGDNNGDVDGIQFIDNRYQGGATDFVTFTGNGAKTLQFGWLVGVTVRNSRGAVISNAPIEIRDASNSVACSGVTNVQGQVVGMPVVVRIVRQSVTADPVWEDRGPYRLRADIAGYQLFEQTVQIASNASFDVVLTAR